jgi:hypothetical protein
MGILTDDMKRIVREQKRGFVATVRCVKDIAPSNAYSRGRPKPNMICAMRRIWISSEPSVMR